MAKTIINDPISHCKRGQGGRTFSRMKPGNKKWGSGNEASSRKMRSKNQRKPTGARRYPFGKYYDWENDPEKKLRALIKFNKGQRI